MNYSILITFALLHSYLPRVGLNHLPKCYLPNALTTTPTVVLLIKSRHDQLHSADLQQNKSLWIWRHFLKSLPIAKHHSVATRAIHYIRKILADCGFEPSTRNLFSVMSLINRCDQICWTIYRTIFKVYFKVVLTARHEQSGRIIVRMVVSINRCLINR